MKPREAHPDPHEPPHTRPPARNRIHRRAAHHQTLGAYINEIEYKEKVLGRDRSIDPLIDPLIALSLTHTSPSLFFAACRR